MTVRSHYALNNEAQLMVEIIQNKINKAFFQRMNILLYIKEYLYLHISICVPTLSEHTMTNVE